MVWKCEDKQRYLQLFNPVVMVNCEEGGWSTQAPARVGLRSSRSEKWKKEAFTLFREVQSEKNMPSLFFEKCKVKNKCFHSFSRSEKWNQNASRPRSRSENSREFRTILEKRDFTTELFCESQKRLPKQMTCSRSRNHQHFDTSTIEKVKVYLKEKPAFCSQMWLKVNLSF